MKIFMSIGIRVKRRDNIKEILLILQIVLHKQDSIYERFSYAANLRFKTGESSLR